MYCIHALYAWNHLSWAMVSYEGSSMAVWIYKLHFCLEEMGFFTGRSIKIIMLLDLFL